MERVTAADEKIQSIAKLLSEWDLYVITHDEYETKFMNQPINDLKNEMWRMYCFMRDVQHMLNM